MASKRPQSDSDKIAGSKKHRKDGQARSEELRGF
jgi:hypothetical protein